MGKIDTLTKKYMSKPEYFADAFNFYFFDGKEVVKNNALTVLDPTEIGIIFDNKAKDIEQKVRDVLKQCIIMEDAQASYLILGIENQTDVHYAMPVKNMIYDALNYGSQVAEVAAEHRKNKDTKNKHEFLSGYTKNDKLKSVITLTIYFGIDEWDAPRSLKEMFIDTPEEILNLIDDYKLHLIIPKEIENFGLFTTDLGKALRYIAASDDKDAIKEIENDDSFRKVSVDTVKLINECTGSKIPVEKGMEEVDMCKGLKEYAEEYADEKVDEKVIEIVENMLEKGIDVKIIAVCTGLTTTKVKKIRDAALVNA